MSVEVKPLRTLQPVMPLPTTEAERRAAILVRVKRLREEAESLERLLTTDTKGDEVTIDKAIGMLAWFVDGPTVQATLNADDLAAIQLVLTEVARLRQVVSDIRDDTRHLQLPNAYCHDSPQAQRWIEAYNADTRRLCGEE